MLSIHAPSGRGTRSGRQDAARRSWPVKLAVPAAAGAVALLAAGCGGTSGGTGSSSHEGASGLAPVTAIALAASQATQTSSFASDMNVQISGSMSMNITGTLQMRTRPSLLLDMDMSSMTGDGQSIPGGMTEIMTSQAMYMRAALFQQEIGKSWIEVPFSELAQRTGTNLTQLLSQAQNYNPLVQTRMLTAAKDVRVVGTQLINGVETTHYTGSYPVAAGLAKLPASERTTAEQQLSKLGLQNVQFNVWIDAQHQTRKLVTAEHGSKESVNLTLTVTGINQPVNATLPPASQVATVPASYLSGK
jgi:hypothetical protein